MKKIAILFVFLLALSTIAIAQDETTTTTLAETTTTTTEEPTTTTTLAEEPGIMPDHPFYGLKIALERIQLALTFNRSAKAKMGLKHARERLLEVQAMQLQKRTEAAERAKKEHQKALKLVRKLLPNVEDAEEVELEVIEQEIELEPKNVTGLENAANQLARIRARLMERQAAGEYKGKAIETLARVEDKLRERSRQRLFVITTTTTIGSTTTTTLGEATTTTTLVSAASDKGKGKSNRED